MNHKDEVEIGNLRSYLKRVQDGEVSGAESFHTTTALHVEMPVAVMSEARKVLVSSHPEANSLVFDELIRTAPEWALLEVSRIFTVHRLCQLSAKDQHQEEERPHCRGRHLQLIG